MYIDISHWNNVTDWEKVKQEVDGVIIKCGGTDSKSGNPYTDSKFEEHYRKCKEYGLSVGCYWFVGNSCNNSASGIYNALEFAKRLEGKCFDLPVFVDFETSTPSLKRGNTDAVISFCNTLENKGYFVGVYASDVSGFDERLYYDELKMFCLWVAKYSHIHPKHNYNLWQYSSTGKISGISGNVDLSIANNDYMKKVSNIIVERGFNGYKHQNTRAKISVEIYTDDYNKIIGLEGSTFADKLEVLLSGERNR